LKLENSKNEGDSEESDLIHLKEVTKKPDDEAEETEI